MIDKENKLDSLEKKHGFRDQSHQTSSGLDGSCDFTVEENKLDDVEKNMDLETRRQTSSGLDGGCDFTDKENKLDDVEKNMDLETRRIYGMYEDGQSVSFIAAEIGKSETYVYTKMRRVPEKYEDVKRMRQESKNSRLRRISSLADMNNERYMEDMWDDSEMAAENIDKINRIGKEYAHRLQLIEGKATENYGVGGKGSLPFQVIITKTYEKEESQVIIDSDKTEDDTDVK